jgi:hypothetical protein
MPAFHIQEAGYAMRATQSLPPAPHHSFGRLNTGIFTSNR